jgi:hypothetical protein
MIELKMARFYGDNNKPDDTSLKDLLSPFEPDRSALTDCAKLAAAVGVERRAIVIYGFDAPSRPLLLAIDAFEVLAAPVRQAWAEALSAIRGPYPPGASAGSRLRPGGL